MGCGCPVGMGMWLRGLSGRFGVSCWRVDEYGGKTGLGQLIFLLYLVPKRGDFGVELRVFGSHLSAYRFEGALFLE